jgi:hypothetical protein
MQVPSVDYAATEPLFAQPNTPLPDAPAFAVPEPGAQDELAALWKKWYPGREQGASGWAGLADVADLGAILGIDFERKFEMVAAEETFKQCLLEIGTCLNNIDRSGLMATQNNGSAVRVILKKMEAAQHIILGLSQLWTAQTMQPSDLPADDHGLWRFIPPEVNPDVSPGQRLKIFALTDIMKKGYRRYRASLMARVTTPEGLSTCAWRVVMDIKAYVRELTARRLMNPQVWLDMTTGAGWGQAKGLIEYLENSADPEVPWLEPDRHVFSFRNGVYMAKDEIFIPYDRIGRFFSTERLPCACKHFGLTFDTEWLLLPDPASIPTPAFDTILDSQELSDSVKRWVFALCGRLMYNVAEVDRWEVFVFFKGLACTGKSSVLNCLKEIYEPQDVGCISNGIEKTFGLCNIAKKFLGIADDVRETFSMDQSDFQNAASGNAISCPQKHKEPLNVDPWLTPIMWSGNRVPGFGDNAGSYSRRMAVLAFWKAISRPDTTLSSKLREQMAAMICKMNRQYRNMVRRHGNSGIWNILPKEFVEQKAVISATSNALVDFFQSTSITRGPELYMPLTVLRDQVMQHAVSCGQQKPHWNADYYRGAIVQEQFVLTGNLSRVYPRARGRTVSGQFIEGCDITINCS